MIKAPCIIWTKIAPKEISGKSKFEWKHLIETQVNTTINIFLHCGIHSELWSLDQKEHMSLHHIVFECLDTSLNLPVGSVIFRLLVQFRVSFEASIEDQYTTLEL